MYGYLNYVRLQRALTLSSVASQQDCLSPDPFTKGLTSVAKYDQSARNKTARKKVWAQNKELEACWHNLMDVHHPLSGELRRMGEFSDQDTDEFHFLCNQFMFFCSIVLNEQKEHHLVWVRSA